MAPMNESGNLEGELVWKESWSFGFRNSQLKITIWHV